MEAKLAFLGVYGSATGPTGLRGAVMVTDESGVPLEIQVAETIRADVLQRRAYRETLQPHAVRELLTRPLLEALQLQPEFVFTNELLCLDASAVYPVFFLADAETLVVAGDYRIERIPSHENMSRLAVVAKTTEDRQVIAGAVEGLAIAQQAFEPLGVFERVSDVIGLLSGSDTRFA